MKRLTNKRNQIHRVWQGQPVAGYTIHTKAYTIEYMLHFINHIDFFLFCIHHFGQNRASVQLLMDFSPYKTNFIIIYIAIKKSWNILNVLIFIMMWLKRIINYNANFKKSWNRFILLIFIMRWLKRISGEFFGIFP